LLYVSTRNKTDSYTSNRALHEQSAPDGGMFVPFRLPQYSIEDIAVFTKRTFGENVAAILNLFFSSKLSGWDVDCCIGRYPVKIRTMGHRIVIAELWHNLESRYNYIEESLFQRVSADQRHAPTPWFRTALRIALLFGLYGQLLASGVTDVDTAFPAGDFSFPMAAWYAKKMGLPINRIVCACNENGSIWDLLHKGEINTGAPVVKTELPELDVAYPAFLEQWIFDLFGADECKRFLERCRMRGIYQIPEESLGPVRESIAAAVVWKKRVDAITVSFYRTNSYILDPLTALSFGAVQDVRARTGENKITLIFSENDPRFSSGKIAPILGISDATLIELINSYKE